VFKLNDTTSGARNDSSWQALVVDVITAHVWEDEKPPGVLDDAKATRLVAHIQKDGQYDDNKRALIMNIKAKAKTLSSKFTL
jgi:hypothetical protein